MGCFTACFSSLSKLTKTKKHPRPPTHCKDQQNLCDTDAVKEALLCNNQTAAEEAQVAETAKIDAEIKEKNEDKLNSSARKIVSFDLIVKTPEESLQEAANFPVENNEKRKREEDKDEVVPTIVCSGEKGEEKEKRKQSKDEADFVSDSSVSSLFSYPPNLRYQNCASSDDDSVDMDFKQSNLVIEVDDKNDEIDSTFKDKNGGGEDFELVQGESSESLFSLSLDSRKQNSAVDLDVGEKEVCSPLKPPCVNETKNRNAIERSEYVQSVLNPIENLSHWKAVRAKTTSPMTNQEKENINMEQEPSMPFREKDNLNLEEENATFAFGEMPSFSESTQQRSRRFSNRPKDDETTVDTSLSSWLMGSEKALTNENSPGSVGNSSSKRTLSPKSFADRPILGALTVEELKHMSKASSASPRRSPSHSPDEMPIIGTVGSYWRQTADPIGADFDSSGKGKCSASSISRHSKKAGMNSTPFQTRLERALEDAVAQV